MQAQQTHHKNGGEASMENFIKHQMMAILQPFVDHVQDLDAHLMKVADELHQTDLNVAFTQKGLEATNVNVSELRNGLKKSNERVTTVREDLEKCNHTKELLQQGLEGTNSNVQKINNSLESAIDALRELQHGMKEAGTDVVDVRTDMKKLYEDIEHNVVQRLDRTEGALSDLTTNFENQCSKVDALKHDFDGNHQFLQDTWHTLQQNNVHTAALQKHVEDLVKNEAALSTKLQDTCHQLVKTKGGLQATNTDVAKMRDDLERNDAAVHALQQGHAVVSQNMSNLARGHEKGVADIMCLQKDLAKVHQQLGDTQDNLGKTTTLANNLHTGLHKTDDDVHKTKLQLDTLDMNYHDLKASFERTSNSLGDLVKGHRKAVSHVQTLQHELDKTIETLTSTRNNLEEAKMDLHDVKGNLSRTNDTMQKLDLGVEFQQACFAGLRKGFQETQFNTKPRTLPKLLQGNSDVKASESSLGLKTKFSLVSNSLQDNSGSLTAR